MKMNFKFVMKSALVGAVMAASPIMDYVPGVNTSALAQNICADGTPFKSARKSPIMNQRVYRKYEKVLEHIDLGTAARRQADELSKQISDMESLAKSKDLKDAVQAAEAKALLDQAAMLKPQIAPLESQIKASQDNAEKLIKDVLGSRRTPDYDRASMLQLYSQIHYERGDTKLALKALQDMLQYGHTLKELREHSVLFNVVQLNYAEGDYDNSENYLRRWQAMNDTVCHKVTLQQNVFIAQLYYQKQNYENVLNYIYNAIDMAEADPETETKENWYTVAASAHYNLGQLEKYRDVVEIMTVRWGKPEYYKRLAGIHSELGDEATFYSLYEAIYEMGWMDESENELKTVAQIQFAQNSNIKAAWIIEQAMSEGRMERNVENMRLLGQAYMSSSEYVKSIEPLEYVAKETQDAQGYFDIASIEYANNNMSNAVKYYDESIRLFSEMKKKQTSKILRAKIGKAAALLDMKQIMTACKIFKEVEKSTKSKSLKRQVTNFKRAIEADIARQDMFSGNDSKRKCK